jgi:hypothetical protein
VTTEREEADGGQELHSNERLDKSVELSAEDEARRMVKEMLEDLRNGRKPADDVVDEESDVDRALAHIRDFAALRHACAKLSVRAKDPKLDVFFRARITAMTATLNLFLDSELSFGWREASLIAAKSQGKGTYHARNIRTWIHQYLSSGKEDTLPLHCYGQSRSTILADEDLAETIKLHLHAVQSKKKYIRALDIVDFIATPEMQAKLQARNVKKRSISLRSAQRWLHHFGWQYGRLRKGMYIDGHERADVVAYRKAFCERWREYEKRMVTYSSETGDVESVPAGFPIPGGHPFRLILVTHDESTFYSNDQRKVLWSHLGAGTTPQPKGDGPSIMISDFLTSEWGRLCDDESDARVVFKAGANRDGYFSADHLLAQVEKAVDIFEGKTNGFAQGLFLFDNAPSHQKRAADALSARKMSKGPSATWTHHKDGPKMRNGVLPDGSSQHFYFPDDHPTMPGWFKGMETIIRERGLWPTDGQTLRFECPGFHCKEGATDCCCRRVLFTQPDFVSQKSQLEEYITMRGHICDFYPKYHCELNFIEQYWGAAKYRYRSCPRTSQIAEMEKNVINSLDDVPLLQIKR